MLLRRYTIEIWLLHRMVKLSLPIAGETGDADNLDGSKVRGWGAKLGERRTSPAFWTSRVAQDRGAGGRHRPARNTDPSAVRSATGEGSAGGDRSHCGRDRPPAAAAVRGAASNVTQHNLGLYSVHQKIPFDDIGRSVR